MDYIFDSQYEVYLYDALKQANIKFECQKEVSIKGSIFRYDFVVYGKYAKIIVESDGEQHAHNQEYDTIRDFLSIQHGYDDVIRLPNPLVNHHLADCIAIIQERIHDLDEVLQKHRPLLDFDKILPIQKEERPYRPYTVVPMAVPETQPALPLPTDPLKQVLSTGDYLMYTKIKGLNKVDKDILKGFIRGSNPKGFISLPSLEMYMAPELRRIRALKVTNEFQGICSAIVLPYNQRLLESLKNGEIKKALSVEGSQMN